MKKDFNEKWSAKAGLRYEYTSLEGKSPSNGATNNVKDDYGKVFPTAYVSFKPNDNHTFSLNYSKRINRPDFQSLNPFRWYTNSYMYYTGTPTLTPSFNDNVELSYSHKGKLTAAIYNQSSSDNISNIARLENGIYSNTVENSYTIVNISERYNKASTIDKRAIVGLIYPEKLTFDGEYFQTTKINSLAGNIALINKELGNKKNRQRSEKTSNVGLVTSTGFKPVTF